MAQAHDAYGALRISGYRRYILGRAFSATGQQMQTLAVGWELYERTHSALSLGLIGLSQVLPVLLFSLHAGHVADRGNRKKSIICTQIVMGLVALGLVVLSSRHGPVNAVYGLLFLGGMARAYEQPASTAFMTQLVPLELLANAITWNSTVFQAASVLGPALGGWLIAVTGSATINYGIKAISAILFLFLISKVRVEAVPRSSEVFSWPTLGSGLKFVFQTKIILAAITLDLFAVLLGGATALLPIYARDILQVGPTGLGWLRAAPCVGAVVMAFVNAHRSPSPRAGQEMLAAVVGFGVATIIFGVSRSFFLSFLMLALAGACDNISVVVRHTLVQLMTPAMMRGRVSAVNGVFISCSNELGEFESGVMAFWFGPVAAVVSGGIGTIAVVLLVAHLWPELKNLKSLWSA